MVNYLWVLELAIADKGEAYMQIENMVAANPQNSFLIFPCSANKDTRAIVAKATITTMNRLKILACATYPYSH